jgi:hypothetical protein
VEEYSEIRDMAEALENRIEITGISEISKANLAFLGILGFHNGDTT